MNITCGPAWYIGQQVFPTIQEAQKKELIDLMTGGDGRPNDDGIRMADFIVSHTDEVVAILTCQPKVKTTRKQRCDIGKKRGKKEPNLPMP